VSGGPAFPRAQGGDYGMTLRDYFAGQALAGITANKQYDSLSFALATGDAYRYADAMLAERERNNP
jgi:hypothetical protein